MRTDYRHTVIGNEFDTNIIGYFGPWPRIPAAWIEGDCVVVSL